VGEANQQGGRISPIFLRGKKGALKDVEGIKYDVKGS
jgi:hypothetical protein